MVYEINNEIKWALDFPNVYKKLVLTCMIRLKEVNNSNYERNIVLSFREIQLASSKLSGLITI